MPKWFSLVTLLLLPGAALAQPAFEAISVSQGVDGEQTYSLSLQLLALMTGLTLLPAALIMMTAFTRIIVVLAILRQALGTAQTPSTQILVGLALFLTLFIMSPVFERVNGEAVQPYLEEELGFEEALKRGAQPLKMFMLAQTRESDLTVFTEIAGAQPADSPNEVSFEIGFLLFIPFLIIDLVVASVLMSMGMMMLSPLIISFPFKIMLFVLVDGWALVVGTLASSFVV